MAPERGGTILRSDRGRVAVLTLNRPERRNALDVDSLRLLAAHMRDVGGDDSVRAVVVTGAGGVAFSAGGDMREMTGFETALSLDLAFDAWQAAQECLSRSFKPVIAAINGYAYGGGTELAMACHIRVAAEGAKLGQPEIAHDHIPGGGGTQRLPRLLPLGVAYEYLLTGEPIPAAEAHRLGLVNHVWPADELMPRALDLAGRIASRSPLALRYTMEAVRLGLDGPLDTGLRLERALGGLTMETDEARAGLATFLDRARKPGAPGA